MHAPYFLKPLASILMRRLQEYPKGYNLAMAQLYPENRDKEEFTSEAEFLIYEEFKKNLDKPFKSKNISFCSMVKKSLSNKRGKRTSKTPK